MTVNINADTTNGLVLTSDTSGEIELQANSVTKAKVTSSGLTDSSGNTYGLSKTNGMYRNLFINGDMNIAQRGTSTTGLQYNNDNNFPCCDRWQFAEFGSTSYTAAFTASQSTDVPSGQGFAKSFKMDCTTADATLESDTAVVIRQSIEAQNLQHLKYGTSSAETLTMSFWVKSNLTGTFTVIIQHIDGSLYYGADYTISSANTWEKKTITIPGDTTASINNDNTVGFRVSFYLAVGSDYASGTNEQWTSTASVANIAPNMTNNIGGSTSNEWYVTGVQLEVGEGASDFEHLPYDVQLQRCQRYFSTSYGNNPVGTNTWDGTVAGRNYDTSPRGENSVSIHYPVQMRALPTLTAYSKAGTSGKGVQGSTSIDGSTVERNCTLRGSATILRAALMTADAISFFQFHYTASAEL